MKKPIRLVFVFTMLTLPTICFADAPTLKYLDECQDYYAGIKSSEKNWPMENFEKADLFLYEVAPSAKLLCGKQCNVGVEDGSAWKFVVACNNLKSYLRDRPVPQDTNIKELRDFFRASKLFLENRNTFEVARKQRNTNDIHANALADISKPELQEIRTQGGYPCKDYVNMYFRTIKRTEELVTEAGSLCSDIVPPK
jgi:hypothetical protein